MKKILFFIGIFLCLYSCIKDQEYEDLNDFTLKKENYATTRTAGDGKFEVLGYGYDITEEYLGDESTKLRILDIEKFIHENPDRFDNPFVGVIDQRCYGGEDFLSFSKQIINESNFDGSVASLADKKDKAGFFSATINTGFKSDTKQLHSSKYSYARAEVFKKQRKYFIHTELETLRKYLSPVFVDDLKKYSADKIVTMYGTHVLTNITVGGSYTAYYKSTILEENSRTEKTKTVKAGAKCCLKKIGIDANGSWSSTTISELNKKNSNWECRIKSIGGSTSGTVISLNSNQETTMSINLGDWSKSVDDTHSRLVDVDWNFTYPIYDLVTDPQKKAELKAAVFKYIDSKKIEMVKLLPLYQYYSEKYVNHSYSTFWRGNYELTDKYDKIIGYIYEEQLPGTIPLYQYYSEKYVNHSYTTTWRGYYDLTDKYEKTLGYISTTPSPETLPLYLYYSEKYVNHNLSTYWRGYNHLTDEYQSTLGYIIRP